jgi:hypothetical protein
MARIADRRYPLDSGILSDIFGVFILVLAMDGFVMMTSLAELCWVDPIRS